MDNKKIDLKNINDFLKPIENINDIKKIKLYKELKVSPISFFILRYLFQKYVVNGTNIINTTEMLYTLSHSNFFKEILEEDDLKEIGAYKASKLDSEEVEEYINMQNYNEIDFFEEDFHEIGYIKFMENIKELIEYGYLQNGTFTIFEDNIFKLFSKELSLTFDFLEIINNGKLEIKENKNKKPYISYKEYIKDILNYIKVMQDYKILKKRLNKESPILNKKEQESKSLKKQIETRLSKTKNIKIPLEEFFKEKKIEEKQKLIIMSLLRTEIYQDPQSLIYANEENLLPLYYEEIPEIISNQEAIFDLSENIIGYEYQENLFTTEGGIVYYLKEEILDYIMPTEDKSEDKKEKIELKEVEKIVKENADFEIIKPKTKKEELILSKETNELIDLLLNQLDEEVINQLKEWGIKNNENIKARIIFSGKPGTGKTATAMAMANELNKYIISFDCSKILSMYVGESEKNVKNIFETYRKVQKQLNYYPILLLNEADQFLGSRSQGKVSGSEQMHNQMQNIFLEEIEKFEGILIATTNLIENLDKAFSRRFNHKIEFKVPDEKMRKKIWETKINKLPLKKEFSLENISKYEITGGQIELIIENTAMINAVKRKKEFEEEDFENQIKKEINSSFDKEKIMGFFK